MGTISLNLNTNTLVISRFVEGRYPRRHLPPEKDTFEDYTPLNQWEFSCLLKPAEANILHNIYLDFIAAISTNLNTSVNITDTTYAFFSSGTFLAQFLEQPEYTEEGIYIRANIRLKQLNPSSNSWIGGLTIAGSGGSLTIAQRNMDNRYPWQYTDPSDSFEKDKIYVKRNQWEITANLTIGEANTLKSIATSFINTLRSGGVPMLTVTDNTSLGNSSVRVWFVKPPSFKSIEIKTDRYVQANISLRELSGDDDPNLWSGSLSIANGGGSITLLQKYLSDKYPLGYSEEGGGSGAIDENQTFVLRRIWEVDYRATLAEANTINAIFVSYANSISTDNVDYVSVTDSTLFNASATKTRFTRFPSYSSEDSEESDRDKRYVKVTFTLEESLEDDDSLLNGAITVSLGQSVTFKQKDLEEKFPRIIAQPSVNEISYSVLGSTILEGYYFQVKHQWNVNANCTLAEATAVEAIGRESNNRRIARTSPAISVSDSTEGGTITGQAVMINFPTRTYNKDNKKKPVKISFSLQEI